MSLVLQRGFHKKQGMQVREIYIYIKMLLVVTVMAGVLAENIPARHRVIRNAALFWVKRWQEKKTP